MNFTEYFIIILGDEIIYYFKLLLYFILKNTFKNESDKYLQHKPYEWQGTSKYDSEQAPKVTSKSFLR